MLVIGETASRSLSSRSKLRVSRAFPTPARPHEERRSYSVPDDHEKMVRRLAGERVESLLHNFAYYAYALEGGKVQALEHISGMARRVRGLHEPFFYNLIPEAVGLLHRDCVKERGYLESPIATLLQTLVHNGPNIDVQVTVPRDNRLVGEELRKTREFHDAVISTAIIFSLQNMGYHTYPKVPNHSMDPRDEYIKASSGEWFIPLGMNGRQLPYDFYIHYDQIGIPGTNGRVSHGINLYSAYSDVRYSPPLESLQIYVGPLNDHDAELDRRIEAVNRKQLAIKQRLGCEDQHLYLVDHFRESREILSQADRIDAPIEDIALPKLTVTAIRMSKIAAQLMGADRRGRRLLPLMKNLTDLHNYGVDPTTERALNARFLSEIAAGNLAGRFTPEQKEEIKKDMILGLLFGPYFRRLATELGIFELFPKLRGVFAKADSEDELAFKVDAEEQKWLEDKFRVFEWVCNRKSAGIREKADIAGFLVGDVLEKFLSRLRAKIPDCPPPDTGLVERLNYLLQLFDLEEPQEEFGIPVYAFNGVVEAVF